MRTTFKLILGAAAIGAATAASFPSEISSFYLGAHPSDWTKRQALAMCEQTNSTFVRFLPSERENCYSRLRNAVHGERTGLWSKHNRSHKVALNTRPALESGIR